MDGDVARRCGLCRSSRPGLLLSDIPQKISLAYNATYLHAVHIKPVQSLAPTS